MPNITCLLLVQQNTAEAEVFAICMFGLVKAEAVKGEVRTINNRNICERRSYRTMVKVPLSNSFLERRDARRKFSQSLVAGASLAPRIRQRISLGSENHWKFRLRSCQSRKASSLSLGVVVPTDKQLSDKICRTRKRLFEIPFCL